MATQNAHAPGVSGVSHLSNEDQANVLDKYTSFYGKEADQRGKEREENAPEIAKSFYNLVTDFYEYGYGESFHFAPIYDNLTMDGCLAKYEVEIAKTLKAKPGMKILDIGCGVGGPARTIGKFCGSDIIGININEYQLERARKLTEAANLQQTVTFQKADFCNMEPFEDNSIDGIYALESTCHSTDPLKVYKEVYRVLKPGALFLDSAWLVTDKFQAGDPVHEKIKHEILVGNGLPDLRTQETVLSKMKEAGLEVVEARDCKDDGDLPWDTYLVGKGCLSLQAFRTSRLGRSFTHYTLSVLETIGVVPAGTTKVHSVLLTAADGLVASQKTGIFTPLCRIVAKKPSN